jgi:hypothetical protein
LAPADSRIRYYGAAREAFDRFRCGWTLWDWKAGFRYWNPDTRSPVTGMREALFPNFRISRVATDRLEFTGIPYRLHRLESTDSLAPSAIWLQLDALTPTNGLSVFHISIPNGAFGFMWIQSP